MRVIRKDVEDRVCEIMVENADKKLKAISVTAENGEIVCYVKAADISSLTDKSFISVNEEEYPVTDIAATPIRLDKKKDGSILSLAGIDETDAVYEVRANAAGLPDGAYKVTVIKERVAYLFYS